VCVFAFDCLYHNGQPMIDQPLLLRRQRLEAALPGRSCGVVELAAALQLPAAAAASEPAGAAVTADAAVADATPVPPLPASAADDDVAASDPQAAAAAAAAAAVPPEERVHDYLLAALAAGAEGLMLKRLSGKYEPSRRSEAWVKLKRDCERRMGWLLLACCAGRLVDIDSPQQSATLHAVASLAWPRLAGCCYCFV
jgi:hypothetical protein